jgi:hypothetical protein
MSNNNTFYINKINNDIEQIETSYINSHFKVKDKHKNSIKEILEDISKYKQKGKTPDNTFWRKLHELSTEPGGFLSIKNRRIIYPFILNSLNKDNKYKVNPNLITKEKALKDELTIKNDCLRSVLFKIFQEEEKLNIYKTNQKQYGDIYIQELMAFTKECLGKCTYFSYYQGYQELSLYFMIIFGRKEGIKYMTLFSKIFLEYVLSKKYDINFEMVVDVLNECCNLVNKKVSIVINKITKTKPYYSLSWLITLFSHSNYNVFHELMLLDYFITSNISHVYFLSANIITNEFKKIGTKFDIYNPSDEFVYMEMFLKHFQNLKINLIDIYEQIKCNEKVNQKSFDDIISLAKRKAKKENDKGTLNLLNNKIYDIKIFKKSSIMSNILLVLLSLIILFFAYKYIKHN